MKKNDEGGMRAYDGGDRLSKAFGSKGADAEEERLRELLGVLKEDVLAPAKLREAVMREVMSTPEPVWRRVRDWWLEPRTIKLSPATGALLAAACVVLFTLWPGVPSSPNVDGVASPVAVGPVVTRFVLVAPEATSVHVTGDFASWDPDAIVLEDLRGTGIWTADVPLEPGVYQYTFIIDGSEWRPDPKALSHVDDGFGQTNSVLIVSPASEA